jgi:hypothetical protein
LHLLASIAPVGGKTANLQAVIALGWRKVGRASWLKPDGTEVYYLAFAEQIAYVTAGDTVHIVGRASKRISALKFSGAFIVKL